MAAKPHGFGPEWLAARLAELIPGYPHVSLCVALSGGLDSTALLAALAAIKNGASQEGARTSSRRTAVLRTQGRSAKARGGRAKSAHGSDTALHGAQELAIHGSFSLRAVHVNHGLHPNAHVWSEHCRALAKRLGVPLRVQKVRVDLSGGVSLEAAARDARYEVLAHELAEGEVLLTAHHEEDQLETVLLQLFRGAGLAGLSAMPPIARFAAGWHARPLLQASRADLEVWARGQAFTWVDDDTNADERLDRNYLRRRVLPLVRERWPGAARTVSRSARHIAEAQGLLEGIARADVERAAYGASLSAKSLRTLSMERRRNALRYWIAYSGYLLPDTTRLDEIAGPLLAARTDANPAVAWGNVILRREADRLTLSKSTKAGSVRVPKAEAASSQARRSVHNVSTPRAREGMHGPQPSQDAGTTREQLVWRPRERAIIELPGDCGTLELQEAARGAIDVDALPVELSIRWRSGGERLRPRRGGPSKSLKSLLQSTRVPHAERARVPLLFDADRLVAVGDFWSDASIQAGEGTTRRARFVWTRYPSRA